ncbi:MAG: methyltransferase domain-containing protein [Acidobacteria bacterium]|nr:methyltransferase domain-containing protein [Acidobacteriota bacterium]
MKTATTAGDRRGVWRLPRYILNFEARIDDALDAFAASLAPGALLLDAGAGEAQHRARFPGQRYVAVDLAVGDGQWDYSRLDALADLQALPFPDQSFDAALNIVTLEHVREPKLVLREIARVLKPGGRLLLVVPLEWEVHQAPHDYFRYTRPGLEYLLGEAGLRIEWIHPAGGIFRLLSRRMLSAIKVHWIAALLAPLALLLPLLDGLDRERNSTLGYLGVARKG